jgi:hypothetical protein
VQSVNKYALEAVRLTMEGIKMVFHVYSIPYDPDTEEKFIEIAKEYCNSKYRQDAFYKVNQVMKDCDFRIPDARNDIFDYICNLTE